MTALSNWAENGLADYIFRDQAFDVASSDIYVSLHTASPTDAGWTSDEVSGGSYARTFAGTWTPASDGGNANVSDIVFPTATANWGTVTHAALWDTDGAAGNMIAWSALTTDKTINNGDAFKFNAGNVTVTFA